MLQIPGITQTKVVAQIHSSIAALHEKCFSLQHTAMQANNKFCLSLGKPAPETYKMLNDIVLRF
jgi:hypothetical protein